MNKKMNRIPNSEKTQIRTTEQAQTLRAKNPSPAAKHGAYEVQGMGYLRCREKVCCKAYQCPSLKRRKTDNPQKCPVLERHIQDFIAFLLEQTSLTPARRAIMRNVIRREKIIIVLDWWLSEVPIAFSEGNVLQVQAAVDKYNALISSQSRDLERLGVFEIAQVPPPTDCDKNVITIYVHDDSIEKPD